MRLWCRRRWRKRQRRFFIAHNMEPSAQTYRYSPLGWAIWLYGPAFVLFGLVLLLIWWTSLAHTAANSGIAIRTVGDWFLAVTCSSRCLPIDYVFSGILLIGFPLLASALIASGLLMMNSDRTTIVSPKSISMVRGSFLKWGRRTWTTGDIADVTVESVMATMVFGNRSTNAGVRWNVGIRPSALKSKKGKRVIVALCGSEREAKDIQTLIQKSLA